ncbi:AAA family ATPase [Myxococcus sp. CA051A]|uniref:AAA family ATPase n=1 Tax=Myxococcus llanfairpwllgwyngyllgogerychwyrndrobwllllantysiliogogogochensis TaxID=2590453 RepID=A0A540X1G9_9BACT|nr:MULTISPECIES: AAA family ATPase [Myxococcus]NTX03732.1 AAA family ATPase [Myxococcus sp. CA040A]NTX14104.1 AAA family ATPase [Myxococcus sp. CA056]NTX35510.1 AAA family ATPase [Myxococcus sp. CA033]NTX55156.1 AAA family ATPase [Myxococcus sp. CA039A]NTX62086.1 AAA family ATPase [Myxococcus sp. CA051A]
MSSVPRREEPVADPISALTFDALSREAQGLRERLNRFRQGLGRHFVGKQTLVDLMTVAAVAQEPLLLVGPPGTAKSDLVLKFREALRIPNEDYFEYLLTRFTEPSEVLGPIDINLLRQGRYIRREGGKLPTAKLVFLDEVFKASSAILNALLTVINERKFYQDGAPQPVKLKVLFAATNELPEHAELGALKDRFCLKAACRPVQDRYFLELLDSGLESQTHRELNQKPWAEGHATLEDLLKAHRYLTLMMGRKEMGPDGRELKDRDLFFRDELLREFRRVVQTLTREDGVFISDRKLVKLYRLLRTRAWIFHGGAVERQDLQLLSYLGETREEIDLLEEKVPRLLGLT